MAVEDARAAVAGAGGGGQALLVGMALSSLRDASVGSAMCFLVVGGLAGSVTVHVTPAAWMAIAGLATVSAVLPTMFFIWA